MKRTNKTKITAVSPVEDNNEIKASDLGATKETENTVTEKTEQKLRGYLGRCDENGIFGWVINDDNPKERVEIDVFIDAELIAGTTANIFRQDLLDAGMGDGNCGFNLPMPDKFFDDMEHQIEIRNILTGELLEGCSKSFILSPIKKFQGLLETCDEKGIKGWIIDEINPNEAIDIDIFIDDELVERTTANIFRQDLLDAGFGDGNHCFNVPVPNKFFDDTEHKVEIREALRNLLLEGSSKTFTIPAKKFKGNLEAYDVMGMRGWIMDENNPNLPVEIDIFVDGEIITQATANIFRQDLLDANIGNGQCGFNVLVPESLCDNLEHQIEVKEKLTGWLLTSFKTILQRNAGRIVFDGFLNRFIAGWASHEKEGQQKVNLTIDNQFVGSFIAKRPRPDAQAVLNTESNQLGFQQDIGGIMQFLALSKSLQSFQLSLDADSSILTPIDVSVTEALSFTPMSLVIEQREDSFSQYFSQIRIVKENILEFTLQRRKGNFLAGVCTLAVYQTGSNNDLKFINSYLVDNASNLAKISVKLYDINKPVLIVLLNQNDNQFILADCIPYPALFHHSNDLMIELHSLFVSRQAPLHVNRRLQKHWFDSEIRLANPAVFLNSISPLAPNRSTTAVIFYARDVDALYDEALLPSWHHLAENAYVLKLKGDKLELIAMQSSNEANCSELSDPKSVIDSFSTISQPYLLFLEVNAVIRADYWSVLYTYCSSLENYKVISGNSIIYDGLSIPYYVGHKPVTGFEEVPFNLLPLSSGLFQRDVIVKLTHKMDSLKSFFPENIIAQVQENELFHLRIPIDVSRELPMLEAEKRVLATQSNFKISLLDSDEPIIAPQIANASLDECQGFSVIINFRNAAEVTKKAITALRMQNYSGNIELILINNDSHSLMKTIVEAHAVSLFGEESVKLIDYPHPFNHSEQTNLAVEVARYPFLLMLSNDAFLLSPHCLERAATLLKNKQVGTTGFRIIRTTEKEFVVESVGLQLALGQLSTLGGQLLKRNIPLERNVDCVMRVAGNTFAAVAMRTEVFKEVSGMNVEKFPTTYNDVEFCLRASGYGLTHIVDGTSIVQHSGRGTREPDLDFPTEPAILKSVHNIDELANGYTLYDFGGLRVF